MWEVVTYALTELILGEKPNEGGADGESEPTNEDDMPVFDAHEASRLTTKYTPPWLRPSRVGSCGAPHQPNQSLLRKLCQSLQKRTFAPNFGFPWGSMISSIRWRSRGCSIGSLRGKNAVNWCSTTGQQMPKQPGLPDKQPHKARYPWRTTRGTAFDLCHRLWNKSTGDCGLRMHQTAVKGNF